MHFLTIAKRVRTDANGATIIEFALVAPIFFFLTLCVIEIGLMLFSQVALESATMQVSRSASIGATGSGCDRACTIKKLVEEKTRGLINGNKVVVEANTLAKGGVPQVPDYCMVDGELVTPTGISADNKCICPGASPWIDNGIKGKCDLPSGMTVGNAGDLVEIRVTYPWKMLIPYLDQFAFVGGQRHNHLYNRNGVVVLSAATVIKNEPF